jgi:hypothetical protein
MEKRYWPKGIPNTPASTRRGRSYAPRLLSIRLSPKPFSEQMNNADRHVKV